METGIKIKGKHTKEKEQKRPQKKQSLSAGDKPTTERLQSPWGDVGEKSEAWLRNITYQISNLTLYITCNRNDFQTYIMIMSDWTGERRIHGQYKKYWFFNADTVVKDVSFK